MWMSWIALLRWHYYTMDKENKIQNFEVVVGKRRIGSYAELRQGKVIAWNTRWQK